MPTPSYETPGEKHCKVVTVRTRPCHLFRDPFKNISGGRNKLQKKGSHPGTWYTSPGDPKINIEVRSFESSTLIHHNEWYNRYFGKPFLISQERCKRNCCVPHNSRPSHRKASSITKTNSSVSMTTEVNARDFESG